ncbi:MAG: hypothetical protein OEQ25_07510 [Gammaproteobacteria bacterium]|nr:hypothetical protein [Gammaproteobacteria bacterium]MDH3506972.1 hypothetical protein [Gammaproteobacteria bacterium]
MRFVARGRTIDRRRATWDRYAIDYYLDTYWTRTNSHDTLLAFAIDYYLQMYCRTGA